ncbi:putative taste receptor T2R11 (predicted) [Rattus norvegicus]|uniref:Taste receptor type 2 member 3 n=2 Tax=Rattus norvegicus TaxID=10116 RepID=TA2R3_RAT|nr:taste receptor type 2 member 3 [Rattus norvegicus]XP_006236424.1 taste receptor type 2 member 3 isoform X1 [Rattus norvegicus]Q67ET7.1 RecName: Full=Taste receptor type 2 member 3; Short=T2R3; AltName: Full=T2R11 [Rattus norvegicus]AAR13342.1 putative taste receptor T2R11 [Rattus norvegicus]EDM15414.1 putative taste receptor T2R11 (predicted) [Rattus norvegicus]|eukprot:NP_001020320.1 taste receptor type 2 member 3 [Rattus norvegicus]
MLGFTEGIFLVLTVTEFILGNLVNGFIVSVNGSHWFKSKKISLSDFIITSLALFRIFLLWIIFTDSLIIVFSYHTHDSGIRMQLIDVFWTFTNHFSIWLISCLSVFYCLKIATFSHPSFLWLKWRASRVVVGMLWGALVLSCVCTMSLMNEFKIYSALTGSRDTQNMTEYIRLKRHEYNLMHVLGNLWKIPSLIVSLIAYFLLLLSLGKHTQQMQKYSVGSRDQSAEAHRRAMRIILSFLLFFLFYFLSFVILSSSRFLPETKIARIIGVVITMSYLVGDSLILILGNNKLKQTFVAILPCECGHPKPGSKRFFAS